MLPYRSQIKTKTNMSNFNQQHIQGLPDRTRGLMDSDENHDGESSHSDSPPAASTKRRTQTEIKALDMHYRCYHDNCDFALQRQPGNIGTHWKRAHPGEPWVIGNVRVFKNGLTYKHSDRHLHPDNAADLRQTLKDGPDWTDEAIFRRAWAMVANGSALDQHRTELKAIQIKKAYKESRMSMADHQAKIDYLRNILAELPQEAPRQTVHKGKDPNEEADRAQSNGERLGRKIRNLFRKDKGSPRDRRSLSPTRPQTATGYRDRTDRIPGGILQNRPSSSRGPDPDKPFEIPYYEYPIPKGDSSLGKSVRIQTQTGTKKPTDSQSSEESEED